MSEEENRLIGIDGIGLSKETEEHGFELLCTVKKRQSPPTLPSFFLFRRLY